MIEYSVAYPEWFIPDPDPDPTYQVIPGPGIDPDPNPTLKLGQGSDWQILGYITGLKQDTKRNFKIF